ncbi:hypothetical protein FRC09_010266, partial [Ceratobasidium sp. 395]
IHDQVEREFASTVPPDISLKSVIALCSGARSKHSYIAISGQVQAAACRGLVGDL